MVNDEGDEIGRILAARNAFEVLDMPACPVAPAVVKRIYRRLALRVHPDKHLADGDRAEAAFKRLTAAHEELADERGQRDAVQVVRDAERDEAAEAMRLARARRDAERDDRACLDKARMDAEREAARRDAEVQRAAKRDAREERDRRRAAEEAVAAEQERRAERDRAEQEREAKDRRRREKKDLFRARRRLRVAFHALDDERNEPEEEEEEEEKNKEKKTTSSEAAAPPPLIITEAQVEELCGLLETEALEAATCELLTSGTFARLVETYDAALAARAARAAADHLDQVERLRKAKQATDLEAERRALDLAWAPAEDEALVKAARRNGAPSPGDCARAGVTHPSTAHVTWAAVADHHNRAQRRETLRTAEDCRIRFKHLVKAAAAPPTTSADGDNVPPPPPSWTLDDQKVFEEALAKFPANADEPKQRWRLVSRHLVGAKSPKECLLRYKELAAAVKKARAPSPR